MGYRHDEFDASSVPDLLDKIEVDPTFASANNVAHVSAHAPIITLADGKIAAPNQGGALGDEDLCNQHLPDFYQRYNLRAAPEDGIYFRWTDDREDIERARSRTIRSSKNHLTGEDEPGLSVSLGLWHYYRMHRFCYAVSGERVGTGCDLEPLIDIGTLLVRSALQTRKQALWDLWDRNREAIAAVSAATKVREIDVFASPEL